MNLPEAMSTLNTPGWKGSLAPAIKQKLDYHLIQLVSAKRPEGLSDDMLRGLIVGLSWVLEFPERVQDKMKAQEEGDDTAPDNREPEGVGTPHAPEEEVEKQT